MTFIAAAFDAAAFDAAPFGPLEFLHQWGLRGASLEAAPAWVYPQLVLPFVLIYLQAYILVGRQTRDTRPGRAALAALNVALTLHLWTSWRFTRDIHNVFNNTYTVMFYHNTFKTIEFGLLRTHINDPYMRRGRGRALAALDLFLNSRMLSLGSVGLDTLAGAPNATITDVRVERHHRGAKHHHVHRTPSKRNGTHKGGADASGANGHSNGHANGATNGHGAHKHDVYVQHDLHRPKTRAGAIARHARRALTSYLFIDTVSALGKRMGPETISGVYSATQPGLLAQFVRTTGFTLLPGVLGWDVPAPLVGFSVLCCVPVLIEHGLTHGYHALAAVALASGRWEVRSWDVDLFDQPWKADSLIDLWGRRWHQMFRHQFTVMSAATLTLLGLPLTTAALVPLTFFFSGLLHAVGGLSNHPTPAPLPVVVFFVVTGLGCMAEVAFKRATGRRVRGPWGRVWTWSTMALGGWAISNAWLDTGICGNHIFPFEGPGAYIAEFLLTHGWAPYTRVQAV